MERDRGRESNRERGERGSSIHWFTCQMFAIAYYGLRQSQKPGTSDGRGSSMWPWLVAFPGTLVESWVRSWAAGTQIGILIWDANAVSGWLTCCDKMPLGLNFRP